MMRRSIFKFVAVLVLYFLASSNLPVLAAGDGSGGGQDEPLSLAASFPADRAQGISQQVQIKLTFNKNVINMSVRDNNRQCFSLTSGGQTIPIDIIMADDQVYPEGKRDVVLKPKQSLKAGTSYTVNVLPSLQAKSGAVLGKTVSLCFTTVGTAASAPAPAQTPAVNVPGGQAAESPPSPGSVLDGSGMPGMGADGKDAAGASQTQPAVSTPQAAVEPQQTAAGPAQESQPQQGPDYGFWMIVKGGLVLAVILAYVLVRYRRK